MLTTRPAARLARLPLAGAFLAALTLAACAGAGPSASPRPTPGGATPTPIATPTQVPGASDGTNPGGGTGGSDPGQGGGSGGNAGTGVLPPGIDFPLPQNPDPSLLGDARYLSPVAGLLNQRNMNVQLVRAAIADDGKVFADLRWYSGVSPCNELDSVKIQRDDTAKTIHLVVVEGSAPGDAMCIELAELHAVAVDLGVLASGSWTISAEGDAPAITLDVP
jgi:hypothetical protein